jgi:2-C-methyl-D-erythritol 4-phosphate cytidylyltransferase
MSAIAIIPAAGSGRRFGGSIPKQYCLLGGRSILDLVLERFEAATSIDGVILVVEAARVAKVDAETAQRYSKVQKVIAGGATRQASVACGVRAIDGSCGCVAVHDAARPFVSAAVIDQSVAAATQHGAAIVALPARDTMKLVRDGATIAETIPRESMWHAQTPQVVQYELMLRAIAYAETHGVTGTDEASLIEAMGESVAVVTGHAWNVKITTPEDMVVAQAIWEQQQS